MSKNAVSASLEDLFDLFEDSVSAADIICAKAMAEVALSITQERLRLGLTQKEFADHIHVSQGLVSRWENGGCNFSVKKLSEIASSLDMNLKVKLYRKMKVYTSNDGQYMFASNNPKLDFINSIKQPVQALTDYDFNEITKKEKEYVI